MAGGNVTILGWWPSPFTMRVEISLNIKSVGYHFVEQNLLETKSELLLKSNPIYKKIPVLLHAHKPLCESLIIVQYIDETWSSAPSILPSDPYDRAVARFWAAYIDNKWFPCFLNLVTSEGEEDIKAGAEQVEEGLVVLEDAFAKCSKGKSFFGGDSVGYVDLALGCFVGWVRVAEKMNNVKLLDEDKMPGLSKWAQKFSCDPAVKDVLPDNDKLSEFSKVFVPKLRARLAN